eukprot:760646-Hanusia_phi.AAC.2
MNPLHYTPSLGHHNCKHEDSEKKNHALNRRLTPRKLHISQALSEFSPTREGPKARAFTGRAKRILFSPRTSLKLDKPASRKIICFRETAPPREVAKLHRLRLLLVKTKFHPYCRDLLLIAWHCCWAKDFRNFQHNYFRISIII